MVPSAAQTQPRQAAPQAEPVRPLLTIALPTFNRARHLDRFLSQHLEGFSALGITFEILVCDDCSTDETPDVVARRASDDARVRLLRQNETLGTRGNVLDAARQARGAFVISVTDDDLLIPESVGAHLALLSASPDIVMLHAPMASADGNTDPDCSSRMGREELFARGDHARCLDFLLGRHAPTGRFIIRTDAGADFLEPAGTFVCHRLAALAHALNSGKVLFVPTPFAQAGVGAQVNDDGEALRDWDRFRGGLEYLASFVAPDDPAAMPVGAFLTRLHDVTLKRIAAAATLHAQARNWSMAYHLDRRLRAYGRNGVDPDMRPLVSGLAAIEAVIAEAKTQARDLVVLDDIISDDALEHLSPALRSAIVRQADPRAASPAPKALALLQAPSPGLLGPDDIVVDLAAAFRRCLP